MEKVNKYTIIKGYSNQLIALIELMSKNPLQTALRFIIDEANEALSWENPYIHGRIFQWEINKSILEQENSYIKKEFVGKPTPHDFLDRVIETILINSQDSDFAAIIRIRIVEQLLFYYKLSKRDFEKERENVLDLFTKIPKVKLHKNFENLLRPEYKEVRKVLESWSEGFVDRDKKFVKQFQESFNSMFWELYLYQCFKVLKMSIDFSKQSPDFILSSPYNNELCVEAVITNGVEGDRHHYESDKMKSSEDIINFASVRILNSLTSKYKHYKEKYSKLSHVQEKPFIIAIAPFEQSGFFTQNNQSINEVLYGQKIKVDIEDDVIHAEFSNIDTIDKNEKTKLEVGLFTTDKYKEISAVIFSTTATFSKATSCSDAECRISKEVFNEMYFESLLDGLQIHRNPFAEYPLDLREFSNYEISTYTYDPKEGMVIVNQNNNTLVSRISMFTTSE